MQTDFYHFQGIQSLYMNTESLELRRLKTDLVTMYKILFSSSFAVGRNFRLIKHYYTVNCYSNSFVGRTVNAWNALPASAFDCNSVSGFKRFFVDCDLSQFLCQ